MTDSTINIAKEFSRTPGARYTTDGQFSGQDFRERCLVPLFEKQPGATISVILDGTEGYATSFLEEAFGGLARKYGKEVCLRSLVLVSEEEPLLIDEIKHYINNCEAHK